MMQYVIGFEQKYDTAKKYNIELPDAVLVFKLLDNALLDETRKKMALTACKDQKFLSWRSALNRVFNHVPNNQVVTDLSCVKEEVMFAGSCTSGYRGRGFKPPFRKKRSIKMGPSVMRRYVQRLNRAVPTLYKYIGKTL